MGRILDDAISEAIIEQDLSYVDGAYADETQFGRGQDYLDLDSFPCFQFCKRRSQQGFKDVYAFFNMIFLRREDLTFRS